MKWMIAVLWGVLLSTSGTVLASPTPKESPQDYATGVMLETERTSFWYHMSLPQDVYQQTAWPDLRDVRVFDRQGDTVPFTLEVQKTQPVAPEDIPLRIFPLDMSLVAPDESQNRAKDVFVLRSTTGIEIHLQSDDAKAIGQSYLLTLPESMTTSLSLAHLRLHWSTPAGNWQGNVSLYSSQDLRSWREIQENAPLMDLTHGHDRLKMDTIAANVELSARGTRYLLLVLDSHSPALTLNGVSAVTRSEQPVSEQIQLEAKGEKLSANEAIWRWAQPQPLTSLRILLDEQGTLPVEIQWRSADGQSWRPLTKTVLYYLNGENTEDIHLSNQLVEAIRMTTIQTQLPESLPVVIGARESYQLIFNSQGKGPYMLVWGNRAAQKADIGLDLLIPAALRKTQTIDDLPLAVARTSVALGGDARLIATSATEQQSLWKSILVWGALILGVAVLLIMAWRIWREVKKSNIA